MRVPMRLLPMLLLLSACATAGAPVADVQMEEQRIAELNRQWVERVAARDAAWIANLYTAEGRIMPANAPLAQGRPAVEAAWRGIFELPNLNLTFQTTDLEFSDAGDMAYDVGTYSLSFDGPQGRIQDQGKYLVVWEKVNGEWKVAADMFNSNLPMQ